jgi:hypothetical protein
MDVPKRLEEATQVSLLDLCTEVSHIELSVDSRTRAVAVAVGGPSATACACVLGVGRGGTHRLRSGGRCRRGLRCNRRSRRRQRWGVRCEHGRDEGRPRADPRAIHGRSAEGKEEGHAETVLHAVTRRIIKSWPSSDSQVLTVFHRSISFLDDGCAHQEPTLLAPTSLVLCVSCMILDKGMPIYFTFSVSKMIICHSLTTKTSASVSRA